MKLERAVLKIFEEMCFLIKECVGKGKDITAMDLEEFVEKQVFIVLETLDDRATAVNLAATIADGSTFFPYKIQQRATEFLKEQALKFIKLAERPKATEEVREESPGPGGLA